jgi:hypothetical protein
LRQAKKRLRNDISSAHILSTPHQSAIALEATMDMLILHLDGGSMPFFPKEPEPKPERFPTTEAEIAAERAEWLFDMADLDDRMDAREFYT